MNWLKSFKPQKLTALMELDMKIFESAAFSAQPTIEDLKKKLGADSKEFKLKFMPVLFEFLYFYLHLANRSSFAQLGAEKSRKLSHEMVKLSIERTIETQMGHWPENLREGIKKDSFHNYNVAEANYAMCKDILLKPEDDTKTIDKIATGQKSKSMVGQLIDNASEIITGKVNTDIIFQLQVWEIVTKTLEKNKKDIDALIPKAFAELK